MDTEHDYREQLNQTAKCIVVKVGSRILTRGGRVDLDQIQSLAGQLAKLSQQGRQICLVSSGAVGTAMTLLDTDRPKSLGGLQAYAAIGQAELIHHYNRAFEQYQKKAAQVLLTIDDMNHRRRYLNLRNTIFKLFDLNAIPVINENDCVATDEISVTFGDNDRLAAYVAMLVDADLLVILSDVDAVYDQDPSQPTAKRVSFVDKIDQALLGFAQTRANDGRSFSKGGMLSKLQAAKTATSVGIPTIIAGGREPNVLDTIIQGQPVGTFISAAPQNTSPKKRWIKSSQDVCGTVTIDEGAVTAIRQQGSSLLPIGVSAVTGSFQAGDLIQIVDHAQVAIGKGISNFSSHESREILGCRSDEILEKLGRVANEELIHRDNLVLE